MTTKLLSEIMQRPVISIYVKKGQTRFISEVKGDLLSPNKISDKPIMPLSNLIRRANRLNILKKYNLELKVDHIGKWYTVRVGNYYSNYHKDFNSLHNKPFTSPDYDKAMLKAYEFAINYNQPDYRSYIFNTQDSGIVVKTLTIGDVLYGTHGEYEWEMCEDAPKPYCYKIGTVTGLGENCYFLDNKKIEIPKEVAPDSIIPCLYPQYPVSESSFVDTTEQ